MASKKTCALFWGEEEGADVADFTLLETYASVVHMGPEVGL